VCVTPDAIQARGELSFEFTDGYRLHVHVFVAARFSGTLAATDEADPFWCDLDALPFAQMWADDALWLPHVLNGRSVQGRFIFEGDSMLDHELEVSELTSAPS
jgi:8-oxo-dGTP diphosphatase